MLRELARSYLTIVKDLTRVMNRLKALYRSWAIPCAGRDGLLYPPSHRVAVKDPGSRRPPARRATLPATRHAATLAPTSAARTASRESEASHHRQATEDSIARAHSLGLSGGSDPDPASFSHQAPAVGLQWTGVGDPHQRGTPLRPRPTAALQKAGLHPGVEQGSQPRSERPIQSRRYQGQCTARTISGFLPEITGQRHQADDGASHAGAQDCSHYADSMEEGRKLRRDETKIASRLSVSGQEPSISSDLSGGGRWFLRCSGSRVSIPIACRRTSAAGT